MVFDVFSGSNNNRILGNRIGTDVTGGCELVEGRCPLGNGGSKIPPEPGQLPGPPVAPSFFELNIGGVFSTSAIQIGGSLPGEGNLISGNVGDGIRLILGDLETAVIQRILGKGAKQTRIESNVISGNGNSGVVIKTVGGGISAESGNLISGNDSAGVVLIASEPIAEGTDHYQRVPGRLESKAISSVPIPPERNLSAMPAFPFRFQEMFR